MTLERIQIQSSDYCYHGPMRFIVTVGVMPIEFRFDLVIYITQLLTLIKPKVCNISAIWRNFLRNDANRIAKWFSTLCTYYSALYTARWHVVGMRVQRYWCSSAHCLETYKRPCGIVGNVIVWVTDWQYVKDKLKLSKTTVAPSCCELILSDWEKNRIVI